MDSLTMSIIAIAVSCFVLGIRIGGYLERVTSPSSIKKETEP